MKYKPELTEEEVWVILFALNIYPKHALVDGHGVIAKDLFRRLKEMVAEEKRWEEIVTSAQQQDRCTCDDRQLEMYGCLCGFASRNTLDR